MKAVAEANQARPLMPVEDALQRLLALAEAAPLAGEDEDFEAFAAR